LIATPAAAQGEAMPEIDNEKFNGEIRKFLKKVGISSQIDIENAVRAAQAEGRLDPAKPLQAVMVLEIPALGLKRTIEHDLAML
jgi:hypothetical protein